jgi:hypothetical protein
MFYHTRDMGNGVILTSNSWARFDSPWIIKYNFNGEAQWGITSTQNRCASVSDLDVADGTVYAVGYTNGSGNSPFQWGNLPALNATGYNFNGWIAAFNTANGTPKWAALAPVGGSSFFDGVSVLDGYVYACGFADPSVYILYEEAANKSLLVKYDTHTGSVIWTNSDGPNGSRYFKVQADAAGVHAVGFNIVSGIRKSVFGTYTAAGSRIATKTVSGNAESLFRNIDSNSQAVYIIGTQSGTGSYTYDGISTPVAGTSTAENGVLLKIVK